MRTIKLTVAYDGTDFVGWQRQENGVSIQGLIEEALSAICATTVKNLSAFESGQAIPDGGRVT